MLAAAHPQGNYDFAAEPKVVNNRSKYREYPTEEQFMPTNIMYDRRVVRGNTYAAIVTTTRDTMHQMKSTKPKFKKTYDNQFQDEGLEADRADVSTPRAVEGRMHISLQTDENVELLTDKPPNYEKAAQTDFYIDRPLNRLYMPQKTGDDRETQIWDGELFDFDHEVEPILQVLMGKALEQGRMEVLEEEELRFMKQEQQRYDDLRYAEMAEAQRMEAEERRRMEESQRRKKQHALKKEQGVVSHKKLMSRVLAKEYLRSVSANAFRSLAEQGTFQSNFGYEVNRTVLPWVFGDIMELSQARAAIMNTLRSITAHVAKNMEETHANAVLAEKERRRIAREEKERLEREKQERRQIRAEARKKRDEEERQRLLKEKITDTLMSKGEQRANIFSQVLSDMDSLGKEGMTVGLVGGVIGEALLILSTIEDCKKAEEGDSLSGLKTIQISKENIQKIIDQIVGDFAKEGKIEIGVSGEIEAKLEAIDPELNLETISTKPTKAKEIKAVLETSINSFVLNAMQEASEKLGFKLEHIEMIKQALINIIVGSDEEKAKRVKLVKAPLEYNTEPKLEAIAVLMPNIEEMPLFNLAEAKGIKQNKKGAANIDQNKKEGEEEVQASPAEVDYEDQVNVFPLYNEELRVLVNQKAASIIFRREVLLYMSSLFKELDMKEIEVLKRVNKKAEAVEEIIANKRSLCVLTFDKY